MTNPVFILLFSVALIFIFAGLAYLWYLNQLNKKRMQSELQCRPDMSAAETVAEQTTHQEAAQASNYEFATKSDLGILEQKIENRFLKNQMVLERLFFILVIGSILIINCLDI